MTDSTISTATSPGFRLAYMANEYPKVSHTFIRREIIQLEKLGHEIVRVSIRPSGEHANPEDVEEAKITHVVLEHSTVSVILKALPVLATRPMKTLRTLRAALKANALSDRGPVRFLAYVAEAAVLLRLFQREGVDHVHVHLGTNGADVARFVQMLGGPTYSVTVHGPAEFDAPIGGSLGLKVHESQFFIAITHYCQSQLRRFIPYDEWDKVHIVHCAIGMGFLAEAEPIANDCNVLVCIGRFTEAKGHMVLINAFAKMREQIGKGRLVLVGDGELREIIEQRIAELGIGEHVDLTGWAGEAEVRERIIASRALVMASFMEGLPGVFFEAFALERPVVTTCITGVPELVKDGENGWLVPASDEDAMAAAMQAAMEAPIERLREMGKAGRTLTLERHHPVTEAKKLDKLFRRYVGATTNESR